MDHAIAVCHHDVPISVLFDASRCDEDIAADLTENDLDYRLESRSDASSLFAEDWQGMRPCEIEELLDLRKFIPSWVQEDAGDVGWIIYRRR